MAMVADRLLTLTYRENVEDYDPASADLSKFLRLVRHRLREFSYVAVVERQRRGVVHWHLALRDRRDVAVLRRLWRRIVGGQIPFEIHRYGLCGLPLGRPESKAVPV